MNAGAVKSLVCVCVRVCIKREKYESFSCVRSCVCVCMHRERERERERRDAEKAGAEEEQEKDLSADALGCAKIPDFRSASAEHEQCNSAVLVILRA